ncbi:NUDIX hydrolase [Pontimonas sp.]|uniref:NUDIX hydrolase n=1 Tax=Pontimonas sp. TaxID=2304492 RepID=UPI00287054C2|nr:NUDIX hydrolase [Pontimonas sp.]MDR9435169.1 NUDIX hydrolase [Pontimonas sp.]
MSKREKPVVAGGAVCWKRVDGDVKVLLVHRTQHKDVSIPKGKRDPGESIPECAKREIMEETGLHVTLGAYLGRVDYAIPSGRDKQVFYWAAEVDPGEAERAPFESNNEIFALEWVSLAKAPKKLSYPHDADILENFQHLVDSGLERTFPLILLRHGKAMPRENWDGPDHTRPLLQRGLNQAKHQAGGIAAFGPERLVSSPATRCLATIEPVAKKTGLDVVTRKRISQDAWEPSAEGPISIVGKTVSKHRPTVLCSHGPVLPQILKAAGEVSQKGSSRLVEQHLGMSTGEFVVIHFSSETDKPRIVAVESHHAPED